MVSGVLILFRLLLIVSMGLPSIGFGFHQKPQRNRGYFLRLLAVALRNSGARSGAVKRADEVSTSLYTGGNGVAGNTGGNMAFRFQPRATPHRTRNTVLKARNASFSLKNCSFDRYVCVFKFRDFDFAKQ